MLTVKWSVKSSFFSKDGYSQKFSFNRLLIIRSLKPKVNAQNKTLGQQSHYSVAANVVLVSLVHTQQSHYCVAVNVVLDILVHTQQSHYSVAVNVVSVSLVHTLRFAHLNKLFRIETLA